MTMQPSTPCDAATSSTIAPKAASSPSTSTLQRFTAWRSIRPVQAARNSRKTPKEIACWGGKESRWVRIARVPCAQAERSANSIRRRTSVADQRAVRSAATACRAESEVPSGLGARDQIWLLSRWVCRSTKAGKTIAPLMSTRSPVPPGTIRPPSMVRSRGARLPGAPTRHDGAVRFAKRETRHVGKGHEVRRPAHLLARLSTFGRERVYVPADAPPREGVPGRDLPLRGSGALAKRADAP